MGRGRREGPAEVSDFDIDGLTAGMEDLEGERAWNV